MRNCLRSHDIYYCPRFMNIISRSYNHHSKPFQVIFDLRAWHTMVLIIHLQELFLHQLQMSHHVLKQTKIHICSNILHQTVDYQ